MKQRWILIFYLILLPVSVLPSNVRVEQDPPRAILRSLVAKAKSFLSVPYILAGESRKGLDCSGLTQRVYLEVSGEEIPRYVRQQVHVGEPVLGVLQLGDLLFFDTEGKGASHVGLYAGEGRVIHAASEGRYAGVVESRLDSPYYKSRFIGARRIFTPGRVRVNVSIDGAPVTGEWAKPLLKRGILNLLIQGEKKGRYWAKFKSGGMEMNRLFTLGEETRELSYVLMNSGPLILQIGDEDNILVEWSFKVEG